MRTLAGVTIDGPGILDLTTVAGRHRLVGPILATLADPLRTDPPGSRSRLVERVPRQGDRQDDEGDREDLGLEGDPSRAPARIDRHPEADEAGQHEHSAKDTGRQWGQRPAPDADHDAGEREQEGADRERQHAEAPDRDPNRSPQEQVVGVVERARVRPSIAQQDPTTRNGVTTYRTSHVSNGIWSCVNTSRGPDVQLARACDRDGERQVGGQEHQLAHDEDGRRPATSRRSNAAVRGPVPCSGGCPGP